MMRYTPLRSYPAFVFNHPLAITATPRALVEAHARGDLPHIPLTELCGDARRSGLRDHFIHWVDSKGEKYFNNYSSAVW